MVDSLSIQDSNAPSVGWMAPLQRTDEAATLPFNINTQEIAGRIEKKQLSDAGLPWR